MIQHFIGTSPRELLVLQLCYLVVWDLLGEFVLDADASEEKESGRWANAFSKWQWAAALQGLLGTTNSPTV